MLRKDQVSKELSKEIIEQIQIALEENLPELKKVYIETYEQELLSIVLDKNSLAKPEYFFDDYIESIDNFNYYDDEENKIILPDEDNFNFSGELKSLKLIVNGTAGTYLELPYEEHKFLKGSNLDNKTKRVISDLPEFFSEDTPTSRRFYLLGTRGTLAKVVQVELKKKLVEFPFSNTSPIDIFEDGEEFFQENINGWISTSIEQAIKIIKGK